MANVEFFLRTRPLSGVSAAVPLRAGPSKRLTRWALSLVACLCLSTQAQAVELFFSTAGGGGRAALPGVAGPYDDADIYRFDRDRFWRALDARIGRTGLPGNADVDGLQANGDGSFLVSFDRDGGVSVPGLGTVQDEDIVRYANGRWSMAVDSSAFGLGGVGGADIDAFEILGDILYFSTTGNFNVGGLGHPDDADIYGLDLVSGVFTRVLDASAEGIARGEDVDGLYLSDPGTFYLSFRDDVTTIPGLGRVEDVDVVRFDGNTWSLYFDGSAQGLRANSGHDLDAIGMIFAPADVRLAAVAAPETLALMGLGLVVLGVRRRHGGICFR